MCIRDSHSTDAIPTVTPEPTETPSENPGEDSSNKPASVEAPVTKEDGSCLLYTSS